MDETMQSCAGCGVYPLPEATKMVLGVQVSDSGHGTVPASWVCGQPCYNRAITDSLSTPRCVGWACDNRISAQPRIGRPSEYCSDSCRKETEKVINGVYRFLARPRRLPTSSAELRDLDARLRYVHATWQSPGWQTRQLGRRVARNTAPASTGLVMEWTRQQKRVVESINDAVKREQQAELDQWHRDQQKASAERARQAHAHREAWRDELEKALNLEPDIATISERNQLEALKAKALQAAPGSKEQWAILRQIEELINQEVIIAPSLPYHYGSNPNNG